MKAELLWAVLLTLSPLMTAMAGDEAALMIVAHGSPEASWNRLVLDVGDEVRQLIKERDTKGFKAVGVAFLEFAEPSICAVVEQFEIDGIERVFVVPLFVAPSRHSGRDLPAALGIYSDPDITATLAREGVEIPNTKIRFMVGPTLYPGDLIPRIALDRVGELSSDPAGEVVIVMAHGDDYYGRYWDDLVHETGSHICSKLGIEEHRGTFIHIGQSFSANGLTAIQRALDKKETVIVANLFLSLDLKAVADASILNFMGHKVTGKQILNGKDVRYCRGLLPDSRVAEWVLDTALKMMTPPHDSVKMQHRHKPDAVGQNTRCCQCHYNECWN